MEEKKESKPIDRFGYPRPAPKPSQTKKKRGPKGKDVSEDNVGVLSVLEEK